MRGGISVQNDYVSPANKGAQVIPSEMLLMASTYGLARMPEMGVWWVQGTVIPNLPNYLLQRTTRHPLLPTMHLTVVTVRIV